MRLLTLVLAVIGPAAEYFIWKSVIALDSQPRLPVASVSILHGSENVNDTESFVAPITCKSVTDFNGSKVTGCEISPPNPGLPIITAPVELLWR